MRIILSLPARLARLCAGLALAAGLASCSTVPIDFETGDVGRIKGELLVFWVQSDRFVYYPAPNNRLRYYLPAKLAQKLGRAYIEPGVMYTDGGSIPKPVQGFVGLSPWGYGPAYIIHDWMFIARRCIATGQENRLLMADRDQIELMRRAVFADSASVLAGIIAALVEAKVVLRQGLAPEAIIRAVSSGFAEALWRQSDPAICQKDTVSAADLQQIENSLGLRRSSAAAAGAAAPIHVPTGPERLQAERFRPQLGGAASQSGARLVTRQSF